MTTIEAISIDDAAKRMSISRAGIYRLIKDGHLRTKKIFQRQVVLVGSINEFLTNGEAVVAQEKAA